MAIALKMTSRGTRQRQRDKRQGKIGSSPAFCRWMVWGSTRTVAGNTWCYERTAEWQAVSPPPRCQSPVWLLSVCHSLTQPTHLPVPSLPDSFLVLRLSVSLPFSPSPSLAPSLSLSVALFFNLSFFSWLAFKLVGLVTATDVRICMQKYFFGPKYSHRYTRLRCPPKIHARCNLLCVWFAQRKSLSSGRYDRRKIKIGSRKMKQFHFFFIRNDSRAFKRKYFESTFRYTDITSATDGFAKKNDINIQVILNTPK